jgi:hypothetical protein
MTVAAARCRRFLRINNPVPIRPRRIQRFGGDDPGCLTGTLPGLNA